MILVQANQVARRFADVTLFENVNFTIQDFDRIALVGRNGTGKSTLIEQIMGLEPLSEGSITKAKGVRIGYLEQHVAIDSDHTIWEEMLSVFENTLSLRQQAEVTAMKLAELAENPNHSSYQQMLALYDRQQETLNQRNAYGIESEIRTVLHGFGFYEEDYHRSIHSLSGGQKTRLALARTLLMNYDLLILDEPTNHLDMQTLSWLENYLKSYRGALLIVSHDRYFLNHVANQVIELRNQTLHTYKGNYDFYLKEKSLRQSQEMQSYQKQQDQIAKLEDFVQRNITRASTTKRAQSRRKQLEKMTKIDKPKQDQKSPHIQFSTKKDSGQRVIDIENLSIGYDSNQAPLAENINLELKKQDAIAVVGPNGIGKTTFLKTIISQLDPLNGEIHLGSNVQIGYYDQNVNQLNPNLTVLETLWQAHDTTDEWKIRSILGSFLFSGETVEKKVSVLSGGEKARLRLALLAMDHDNTLILDEPTNHLDIDSKEVLEEALIDFDGTLLFVSHDRYFINRIATQIIELSPQGSTLYLGDYDYYQNKKQEMEEIANLQNKSSQNQANHHHQKSDNQRSYESLKELRSQQRKLEQTVEKWWERQEALEEELTILESNMAQAATENDSKLLTDLHQQQIAVQEALENAINRWEEAAIMLEEFLAEEP